VLKRERESLSAFNNFFNRCFWSHGSSKKSLRKVSVVGDPIDVSGRSSTLRNTLNNTSSSGGFIFNSSTDLPVTKIAELNRALYYYNFSLGSKSIENSLSLLWTSLETMLPYRRGTSDISCVQHFVSKSLAVGCLAREINGLAMRVKQTNQVNKNGLNNLDTISFKSNYTASGLLSWFEWSRDEVSGVANCKILSEYSQLLAYQFSSIGGQLHKEKCEYLLKKLRGSRNSIHYQLQRIYVHRNHIVHSGDFINEYTNLWLHLEWYVGKMLSKFYLSIYYQSPV